MSRVSLTTADGINIFVFLCGTKNGFSQMFKHGFIQLFLSFGQKSHFSTDTTGRELSD